MRDRTLLAVSSDDGGARLRPIADLFRGTEPDVPRQIAEKLLRTADEIADVDGTIVWLNSSRDSLVPDRTADR